MSRACYVYTIMGRDTPLPAAGTRSDAGLATVVWHGLAAVIERVPDEGVPLTMEAVLHHEAVVEAVRQQGPALPVRFGTVFRDAASVGSALAGRYESLAAELDRLGDKVELGVTALWAEPPFGASPLKEEPPAEQISGAHYLRRRAAEHRREDAVKERARVVAREIEQALGGLALERRASLLGTARVAVRTAYLLDPARVSAFRAAFDSIRGSRGELRILLSGPWPPYSFVRQVQPDGATDAGDRLAALAQY